VDNDCADWHGLCHRVVYDAFRIEAESKQSRPEVQQTFQQHKLKFDQLRQVLDIKLQLLDENRVQLTAIARIMSPLLSIMFVIFLCFCVSCNIRHRKTGCVLDVEIATVLNYWHVLTLTFLLFLLFHDKV